MTVYVASINPVKINSTRAALKPFLGEFEVSAVQTESGVSDQPFDEETYLGAENRVDYILHNYVLANDDYAVGIEGGIFSIYGRYVAKGIVCISNGSGLKYFGESAGFELPGRVMEKIKSGLELGEVIDLLTGEEHTKQKGGAIGYLSGGKLDRNGLYSMGILNAFIPFLNEKLYVVENDNNR